uniref:BHLH domain-containing protein n=1 Tax=Tetradesmus obliquus TaxID=3088 RepID=A0A383VV66_TETOB|eukprot:jgi/Sobl393_1/8204/SZX69385.1
MEQQVPLQPDAAAAMWPLCQQAGPIDHGSVSSYLDFLSDDLLGSTHNPLDAGTLAAAAAAQDPPGEAKRKRLKREAADAGSNGEEDLSDDDEDEPRGKSGKRKTPAAAQNKANREKARREKINDRFTELAKMVDPSNEPKTDKLSILGEAIRFVQQTQVENSQLRQLNKFLEEKVGQLEKERAQMLYQMYQFSGSQMMQPGAAAGMMQQAVMMPGMAPMQQPAMQVMQPMQQMMQPAGAAGCSSMAAQQPQQQLAPMQQQPQMGMVMAAPGDLQRQQSQQLLQQPDQQQGQQVQQVQDMQQQLPVMQQQQQLQQQQQPLLQGKALMTMPGAAMPMPYWQSMMPPSMLDSTQDSLLRPPAA